jgi:transposase InsO family protein
MESFFATLKKELIYRLPVHRMRMDEVRTLVFRYVFTYYNRVRVYTSNPNGLPPKQFRDAALRLAA